MVAKETNRTCNGLEDTCFLDIKSLVIYVVRKKCSISC